MTRDLLAGRRGLIVGFSGEASVAFHCAKVFREQGAEIAITSRPERLDDFRGDANEVGCSLHLAMDAEDPESIAAVFSRIEEEWGSLDFVLHALMHVPQGVLQRPLLELSRDDFHTVVDVGVLSLIRVCQHALPLMRKSDAARIVTLSSESSMLATPNYHVAGISKAALESASRYLALELGRDGILCNVASFSALASGGAEKTIGKDNMERTREHLAKRSMTGQANDWVAVANTIAWMCSPMLQNISGQKIVVDGGYSVSYF